MPIDLPPRELALLTTLAIRARPWPSYQLIPLLWPGTPSARNSSLKVYVHRLRRRLGAAIISSTNKGYELDRRTSVDLWEAQTLLAAPTLTGKQQESLANFYAACVSADRSMLRRCEWFDATEELIEEAISEVATRLVCELRSPPLPNWPSAQPPSGHFLRTG
ncbi:MAG: hypothetical protein NVS9B12_06420 [Vulcanimicrobiaceae bacterium]